MPAKKKKGKKGSKKKKAAADGDENKTNENDQFKVEIPQFGWIKLTVSQI